MRAIKQMSQSWEMSTGCLPCFPTGSCSPWRTPADPRVPRSPACPPPRPGPDPARPGSACAARRGGCPAAQLAFSPGISPHTHTHTQSSCRQASGGRLSWWLWTKLRRDRRRAGVFWVCMCERVSPLVWRICRICSRRFRHWSALSAGSLGTPDPGGREGVRETERSGGVRWWPKMVGASDEERIGDLHQHHTL